ncbi:MAG TPA: repressor LexA, partial [Rhodospirillaceae bacterium]|nr:repressor LexA [Rhodospirillaceae bacterium]
MLTRKQRDLLLFIHERMSQGDIAPSFEEMKEALGLKSKSGIHRLISGLVERGYLERLPHRARALEVKKLPDGYAPANADQSRAANVSRNIAAVSNDLFSEVPFLGKIAAGTPIEAIRDEGRTVQIPPDLMGNGEHYALKVQGDSMVNAGIHDK